nr:ubiquitin-like domain-containing protein [Anaerolineae bacterium]
MAIQAESKASQSLNRVPAFSGLLGQRVERGLIALGVLGILWAGYFFTAQPITLEINGQPHHLRTHRPTVEAVLNQMGLYLEPEDIIQPALGS